MLKRIFLLLMTATVLQACGSGSSDTNNQIDYATLDSLQTEVVLEIGETKDYLPGQLTNLAVAPNGDILVADWASKTIEQFDENGNHRGTIAKGGGGPGEMSDYFMFNKMGNDTLLVTQLITSQKDYFVPDSDGMYRFLRSDKPAERPDRSFTIIGAQSETSYYATVGGTFSFNLGNEADYSSKALVVVNSSGEVVQDSVQMYKTANPYVRRGGTDTNISIRTWQIPYRFDDDLSILPDGSYLVARADSNAIFKYSAGHELQERIPLNVKPRPVTAADIDEKLGDDEDMGSKSRNEMESKITDQKPPFLNVFATQEHIFLHTESNENGKEFVVLDYDGNPLGKFTLPEVDSIQHIKENAIYTIHRSPEKGHTIRAYRVQF